MTFNEWMNEWMLPIKYFDIWYCDDFLFSTISGEGKTEPSNHKLESISIGNAEIKLSFLFSK